ncbi:TPA: hypothetical protein DCW38_02020 [candidate division WOR-3 bacterium]|jgi:hypothetical protein|uniref:Uncharacterized protein n=1 Tax=candidate division WOR-3 bacterium TaxID=2052148 RepID=A0A350H8S5_UNCW3|nr:hypothetical protein [candidate division WOR-3 bacterium]
MKLNVLLVIVMIVAALGAFASITFSIAMTQCNPCCIASSTNKTISVSPYTSSMNILLNE